MKYTVASKNDDWIQALRLTLIVCTVMCWWSGFLWAIPLPLTLTMLLNPSIEESVLAIEGVGIQIERKGLVSGLTDACQFYSAENIMGIFINEVFEGAQVKYVLQLALDSEPDICLVFSSLRPRLPMLRQVWKGLRSTLLTARSDRGMQYDQEK